MGFHMAQNESLYGPGSNDSCLRGLVNTKGEKKKKRSCAQVKVDWLLARLVVRWPCDWELRTVGVIGGGKRCPSAGHPLGEKGLRSIELNALQISKMNNVSLKHKRAIDAYAVPDERNLVCMCGANVDLTRRSVGIREQVRVLERSVC